ncbi:MAG: DNA-binding response regulator, partial [Gammaproteobacteria bacterium]
MIRLLLADDHRVVLDGLCTRLAQEPDLEVVAKAHDGEQAVELAVTHAPDVVLMDVSMPRMNGLEAASLMRERCPDVKVLILSMHDNREYVREALERGVAGYVLKDVSMEEMVRAIHTVQEGGSYISSGASQALLAET